MADKQVGEENDLINDTLDDERDERKQELDEQKQKLDSAIDNAKTVDSILKKARKRCFNTT